MRAKRHKRCIGPLPGKAAVRLKGHRKLPPMIGLRGGRTLEHGRTAIRSIAGPRRLPISTLTLEPVQESLTTAPAYVVDARGLSKRYGTTVAVAGVDLLVQRGSVFGVLGPNGSGKSTTVRMLLGLVRPDHGEVTLFGRSLEQHKPEVLGRIGSVVETPSFIPYLSGRDNLRLLDRYTPGAGAEGIERALTRVRLQEAAHRRFKNYSLGMKQRLGIAAAILHDPELIILDEPTNGLDPQGTREVRELIPELAAEGRTVLLCSHLLHEVEQLCESVAIFQNGRVIAQGRTADIIGRNMGLEIKAVELDLAEAALRRSPWAASLRRSNGSLFVSGPDCEGRAVNRYLVEHGVYADALTPQRQTLEEAFFQLTSESESR
jgi:ABC-2 type transport system ATP-binding protein